MTFKVRNKRATVYSASICGVEVSIHHHIYYDPDEWLLTCKHLGLEAAELHEADIGKAIEKAKKVVADAIVKQKDMLEAIQREFVEGEVVVE